MGEPTSGAQAYAKTHAHEMDDHVIAFESDMGTRNIWGWGFSGSEMAYMIVKKINELFLYSPLDIKNVQFDQGEMTDTEPLLNGYKVPAMRNLVGESADDRYYFTYHHSAGDTVSVLEPEAMDKNVAAIACLFYIIADLPNKLPK
jgi:carboxypeptidase Q